MIVKIVSKGTTEKSLARVMDYAKDEKKCILPIDIEGMNKDDGIKKDLTNEIKSIEYDSDASNESIQRVINYMANESKIKKKYISGYLCDPDSANEEFYFVMQRHLDTKGQTLKDVTGYTWYHLVQSFPEELEISDEEVHQCGIELLQKLKKHQGVVASHVHPEIKEDGEIKGKCKHNHIIFNSFIYPDFIDPNHPNRIKYHDCKETYNQLQIWNDEIALEHGLPIIVEPDMNKTYSWYESNEVNKGTSWKERVRIDIENTKRVTSNWNEFVSVMEKMDYKIRDKQHVTYTTPNDSPTQKQRVRDITLGREYTKEYLLSYFELKNSIKHELNAHENQVTVNDRINLIRQNAYLKKYEQDLFVKIIKNKSGKYADVKKLNGKKYTLFIPLSKQLQESSVLSYFSSDEIYELYDKNNKLVEIVSGIQLIEFFENKNKETEEINLRRLDEEMREYNEQQARIDRHKKIYYRTDWVMYKTKKPYSISLFDRYGRRRSTIELLVMLAILLIDKESPNWLAQIDNYEIQRDPIYAKRDWKIQNMIDTLQTVKEENINSPKEIVDRLMIVGKKISQIKREISFKSKSLERMSVIYKALEDYNKTHVLCNNLYNMPKSLEKENLIREHKQDIDIYTNAKATLHHKNINNEEEMKDFLNRYNDIKTKMENLKGKLDEAKQEYRKFKKLEYNVQLAQNTQYVCGPNYNYKQIIEFDYDRGVKEIELEI